MEKSLGADDNGEEYISISFYCYHSHHTSSSDVIEKQ